MKMHRTASFALLVCLPLCTTLSAQSPRTLDAEFKRLDSLNVAAFRLAVDTLHFKLTRINNPALRRDLTERLFAFTAPRDPIAHIRSLAYPEIYPDSTRRRYLNEAFTIAQRHHSRKEMAWVEERRCRFYMHEAHYDSAMISLLRLRDEYTSPPESDDRLNIAHLLGDIYFKTGLYDQARKVYLEIVRRFEGNKRWDFWRPYVVMNNLGLIGIETGDPEAAAEWFKRSLNTAHARLTIPERENIMAFSIVKLMETHLKADRLNRAQFYLNQAEAIPPTEIYTDVQQELLFLKSRLKLEEGDAKSALQIAETLMDSRNTTPNGKNQIEINLLMSQIHKAMGHTALSLSFLERFNALADSLNHHRTLTRSLLLLAEKDHEMTREQLRDSRQQKHYLAMLSAAILLALVIVLHLYHRIYLSRLRLVNKTIENDFPRVNRQDKKPAAPPTSSESPSTEKEALAQQFQALVLDKKLYLDPELTLQKTALYLSTNRTYLSNAVNLTFDINFPTYINRLRVQESIRLISEGFTSKQTLEALAKQSGFASRTVFITAFKKYTGVPPSFFIKNYETQYCEHFQQ